MSSLENKKDDNVVMPVNKKSLMLAVRAIEWKDRTEDREIKIDYTTFRGKKYLSIWCYDYKQGNGSFVTTLEELCVLSSMMEVNQQVCFN